MGGRTTARSDDARMCSRGAPADRSGGGIRLCAVARSRGDQGLAGRDRSTMDMFQRLMDPVANLGNYRDAYNRIQKPPCIPFFRTRIRANGEASVVT